MWLPCRSRVGRNKCSHFLSIVTNCKTEISFSLRCEIHLLLIGETGTGKSTFINSFVNFLFYKSLEEATKSELKYCVPSHFDFVDDDYQTTRVTVGAETADEIMRDGQSATQVLPPRKSETATILDGPH